MIHRIVLNIETPDGAAKAIEEIREAIYEHTNGTVVGDVGAETVVDDTRVEIALKTPEARQARILWKLRAYIGSLSVPRGDPIDRAAGARIAFAFDEEAMRLAATAGLTYIDFCKKDGDDHDLQTFPTVEEAQEVV